jgi:hypothetical protein
MNQSKLIIAIVLIIFIGIVVIGYYIRKNKIANFKENGIETTARITEKISKKNRRLVRKKLTTRKDFSHKLYFEITYFTQKEIPDSVKSKKILTRNEKGQYQMNLNQFNSGIGSFVITTIRVNASQYRKYKKDDKIQILYLKDDPEYAILMEDLSLNRIKN